MNRRIRRSAASALRISLISGCGALGWLALSAGAATANDDGGEQGLLGSVTSVVESVATPVKSVVEEVSAPLVPTVEAVVPASSEPVEKQPVKKPPAVSDLVSNVPEFVGDLSVSETVEPVTNVVDSTLDQVPVVNSVLPPDTTTGIIQPVLETVDSAVAPVIAPVQHVVTPVVEVLDPVVETLDPVVELVDPIVKPIVDPVVDVVDPVVKPAPPVVQVPDRADVVEPVLPDAAPVVPTDPAPFPGSGGVEAGDTATVRATQDDNASGFMAPAAESESSSADERTPRAQTPSSGPMQLTGDSSARAEVSFHGPNYQGAQHKVQEAPQLALADVEPTTDPLGSPANSLGTSAASAGSSASGGMGAADTPSLFAFNLSSLVSLQAGYSGALPQGPTFDPGSTPD